MENGDREETCSWRIPTASVLSFLAALDSSLFALPDLVAVAGFVDEGASCSDASGSFAGFAEQTVESWVIRKKPRFPHKPQASKAVGSSEDLDQDAVELAEAWEERSESAAFQTFQFPRLSLVPVQLSRDRNPQLHLHRL